MGVDPPGNASCVWAVPHIQAHQPPPPSLVQVVTVMPHFVVLNCLDEPLEVRRLERELDGG